MKRKKNLSEISPNFFKIIYILDVTYDNSRLSCDFATTTFHDKFYQIITAGWKHFFLIIIIIIHAILSLLYYYYHFYHYYYQLL